MGSNAGRVGMGNPPNSGTKGLELTVGNIGMNAGKSGPPSSIVCPSQEWRARADGVLRWKGPTNPRSWDVHL